MYIFLVHCEPGKYEKEGKCEMCDIGSYKESAGNGKCTPCPSGSTTSGPGTNSEDGCSRGRN